MQKAYNQLDFTLPSFFSSFFSGSCLGSPFGISFGSSSSFPGFLSAFFCSSTGFSALFCHGLSVSSLSFLSNNPIFFCSFSLLFFISSLFFFFLYHFSLLSYIVTLVAFSNILISFSNTLFSFYWYLYLGAYYTFISFFPVQIFFSLRQDLKRSMLLLLDNYLVENLISLLETTRKSQNKVDKTKKKTPILANGNYKRGKNCITNI